MIFPESPLAHQLLDGLKGIEIGPSAHNPFGLRTWNVGHDTKGTVYEAEELRICGNVAKMHVIADASALPFRDSKLDFVLASHVLEHQYNLIGTIGEWLRVVKSGGFVYVVFPHKERTFDRDRMRTTWSELVHRAGHHVPSEDKHWTVAILDDALEWCEHMNWKVLVVQDVDDKVGNGFTFVIQKE